MSAAAGAIDGAAAASRVLDFWFGAPGTPARDSVRKEWFIKDEGFDRASRRSSGS